MNTSITKFIGPSEGQNEQLHTRILQGELAGLVEIVCVPVFIVGCREELQCYGEFWFQVAALLIPGCAWRVPQPCRSPRSRRRVTPRLALASSGVCSEPIGVSPTREI